MSKIDVIGIGAVNYDYMFQCEEEDLILEEKNAGNNEDLSNPIAAVENDILELIGKGREYSTQVGGSAFITLRVVKHIASSLQAAYVGVCGLPGEFNLKYGKTNDFDSELAFLDNQDWLFTTKDRTGSVFDTDIAKSVVRLYNHSRNCIKITPCANNTLLDRIREKEASGESLAKYLSQARWIHLSSLAVFDHFKNNFNAVKKAKELNPLLKVSVDPGSEFTAVHPDELIDALSCSDYIFLNTKEKTNLGNAAKIGEDAEKNFASYLERLTPSKTRTFIVKFEDHHDLIRYYDGEFHIITLQHTRLEPDMLHNDTGAGDSFAGGFIAGMLHPEHSNDVVYAVKLGTASAIKRMTTPDSEKPYLTDYID